MWEWLFDSSEFLSRSHCGLGWTETLILRSKFANFLVFCAYCTIPISLSVLWYNKRRQIPRPFILIMFMHFIFFCGITHLNDVLVFHWPAYRFFTLIDELTACFSIATAIILPFVVVTLLKYPSIEEMKQLNNELDFQIKKTKKISDECTDHNLKLIQKVEILEHQLKNEKWIYKKYDILDELKEMLYQGIRND